MRCDASDKIANCVSVKFGRGIHRDHPLGFDGAFAVTTRHLKRSLLGKMPGEDWEQFANLRLLFTFMYAHPGKKLLFMGGELGQASEWDHARGLDWRSLENKANRALGWFFQDLNRVYRSEPALFEADFKSVGFEWLEVDNADESIIAFLRKAKDPRDAVLFAANFSALSAPTTASVSLIRRLHPAVRQQRQTIWRLRRRGPGAHRARRGGPLA